MEHDLLPLNVTDFLGRYNARNCEVFALLSDHSLDVNSDRF